MSDLDTNLKIGTLKELQDEVESGIGTPSKSQALCAKDTKMKSTIDPRTKKGYYYYGKPNHKQDCWMEMKDCHNEIKALRGGSSKQSSSSGTKIERTSTRR